MKRILFSILVAFVLTAGCLVPAADASPSPSILQFDFSNGSVGQVSGIAPSFQSGPVTSASFDTGNSGIEDFGGTIGNLSLTRFFSNFGNRYPFFSFVLSQTTDVDQISFYHIHNHNPGYPTYFGYDVDLQYSGDNGASWATFGTFNANQTYNATTTTLAGPGVLGAGTHMVRWVGYNFWYGNDSDTEFFGLDNVTLTGTNVPEPTTLSLLAVGLAGLAVRLRKKAS